MCSLRIVNGMVAEYPDIGGLWLVAAVPAFTVEVVGAIEEQALAAVYGEFSADNALSKEAEVVVVFEVWSEDVRSENGHF